MKNSSNIIPFYPTPKGKSRLTEDDIYNTCYDKWITIPRACNNRKTIPHEAVFFIAAFEFLFLKDHDEIIFSPELLSNKTIVKKKQRGRFLKMLADIYHIDYHPGKYIYKGKVRHSVFSAKRTESSLAILANPKLFYSQLNDNRGGQKNNLKLINNTKINNLELLKTPSQNDPISSQKRPRIGSNLTPPTYIDIETKDKELKNTAYSSVFFNSVLNVDRMGIDTSSEDAALPTPTPKPRIRVQAEFSKTSTLVTEQTDLLCYPDGAASQPCSTENEQNEIVAKKDELVTNCHELNQGGQPETPETSYYGDSHNETNAKPTVLENRTTEPLQPAYSRRGRHYAPRKTQNLSDSKGMASLSELLGEMLNSGELFEESELSTESQQLEPQSPTSQGLPLNEYLNQLNRPIPENTDEEAMKAYDWDNPANKLDLAIARNFDTNTAQELTCDIDYCYLEAETKLRLVFKKKLAISEHNKSRLKQIIRDVYGDNTEIVYTLQNVEKDSVAKTARSQEKFSKQTHKTQKHSSYSGNSYPDNKPKIPSYEERQKALKEFYVKQFAEWDKEIEEKKAKELELEKQKALGITKPKKIFSPLAIEIFAKRRTEREANNPERSKVNVEEEVKKALMLFEEEQKRKNIPQCEFVGLTESAERPLPHIKVPECWNVNKPKSEEV
ncbi:hypothetical protein Trichorick_01415 (plasmid) [Candidatus Trichorickettsia mobilis]|uniref:Uncharacterized protein n=1 Tax=Candidatus Trichorickettsia mobilis TaxID=1346319 RepID=A0ABZ0UTZ2_9RICK|nr:hypothetical protein [Candidatus Trichorickettsia mobilis]WPY01502.1 hypothetical protein Trichorick_01415 [Candidatus Trichorickettsia mobilis]